MNILSRLLGFFESLGRARAAAELARAGLHQEARELMMDRSC